MGVILDTSVWIEVERGRLSPDDVADRAGDDQLLATPVTIAEIGYGLVRAKRKETRERCAACLAQIEALPCLPIDAATGRILGAIAADADARGRPAKHRMQDLWLASLAIQHDCTLVTGNPRDFEDIPGLRVVTVGPAAT